MIISIETSTSDLSLTLLNKENAEEAKARESASVKAAKDARVASLRAFKPLEVMGLINRAADLARQYKARLEQDLTPSSEEQAQKNFDKQKAIADGLIAEMEAWLNSSFSDEMDQTRKTLLEGFLENHKSKLA